MAPQDQRRAFHDCGNYSKQLGDDYRRLYQLKESGGSDEEIQAVKNKIKSDKSRLKNTIRRLNSG